MEIRKLTVDDHDEVEELFYQLDEFHVQNRPDCFVHKDKSETYPIEVFTHNLEYPGGLELGAFENGIMVGFVRATLWEESFEVKGTKTAVLDNIYVLPDYRRKGIAAKLFSEVENWAKEQGAVRLDLYTWDFNKGAIAMYQAMGMAPQRYVFEKKL